MSEALTVHSHFEDVAQLSEGLADRVEDGRVILYGPTNYETGDKIPFAVLLLDGSPVIEGFGVVAASVDGGEDRPPEIRYDVVLTDLEMDARSDVMFARILMAGDASRETSLPEEVQEAESAADVDMGGFTEESTAVADLSSHAAAMMPAASEEPSEEEVAVEEAAPAPDAAAGQEPGDLAPADSAEDAPADDADDAEDEDDVPVSTEVEPEAFSVTEGKFVEGAAQDDAAAHDEAAHDEAAHAQAAAQEHASEDASEEDISHADSDDGGFDDGYGDSSLDDPYGAPADAGDDGPVLVDGAMAPPTPPAAPAGFTVARLEEVGLSRPVHAATWWPEPSERPAPDDSTGAFEYSGALPIPNQPPRPDLDPSQRVAPAPHPVSEGSAPELAAAPDPSGTVDEHAATMAAQEAAPAEYGEAAPAEYEEAAPAEYEAAAEVYDNEPDLGDGAADLAEDLAEDVADASAEGADLDVELE